MGAALLKNPDKVKDVSFSLVVACDLLGAVYMGGGTGHLPGRDVFYPDFKNCLYGRWDRMFARTGRFLSWL